MKRNAAASEKKVVHLSTHRRATAVPAVRIGRIVGLSEDLGVLVTYPENPHGPIPARVALAIDAEELQRFVESHQQVLLAFDGGRSNLPIVTSVMLPLAIPRSASGAALEGGAPTTRATVDGREVLLRGAERVELRCGKASIVLTKSGKVVIRGAYVSSRSSGANRVRGASVEIN